MALSFLGRPIIPICGIPTTDLECPFWRHPRSRSQAARPQRFMSAELKCFPTWSRWGAVDSKRGRRLLAIWGSSFPWGSRRIEGDDQSVELSPLELQHLGAGRSHTCRRARFGGRRADPLATRARNIGLGEARHDLGKRDSVGAEDAGGTAAEGESDAGRRHPAPPRHARHLGTLADRG